LTEKSIGLELVAVSIEIDNKILEYIEELEAIEDQNGFIEDIDLQRISDIVATELVF
jgi:hypothetical protein